MCHSVIKTLAGLSVCWAQHQNDYDRVDMICLHDWRGFVWGGRGFRGQGRWRQTTEEGKIREQTSGVMDRTGSTSKSTFTDKYEKIQLLLSSSTKLKEMIRNDILPK